MARIPGRKGSRDSSRKLRVQGRGTGVRQASCGVSLSAHQFLYRDGDYFDQRPGWCSNAVITGCRKPAEEGANVLNLIDWFDRIRTGCDRGPLPRESEGGK